MCTMKFNIRNVLANKHYFGKDVHTKFKDIAGCRNVHKCGAVRNAQRLESRVQSEICSQPFLCETNAD